MGTKSHLESKVNKPKEEVKPCLKGARRCLNLWQNVDFVTDDKGHGNKISSNISFNGEVDFHGSQPNTSNINAKNSCTEDEGMTEVDSTESESEMEHEWFGTGHPNANVTRRSRTARLRIKSKRHLGIANDEEYEGIRRVMIGMRGWGVISPVGEAAQNLQ